MHTQSQSEQILSFLKKGNSITALEALSKFGCFRLAARVADLRHDGHNIKSETVELDGKRFASYTLIKAA